MSVSEVNLVNRTFKKEDLNAGCSLPPTTENPFKWPSIWEKENQGTDDAAFIGNANLNTIA